MKEIIPNTSFLHNLHFFKNSIYKIIFTILVPIITFLFITTDAMGDTINYTVVYNANGATGGTIPDPQTKEHDITLTLATNSGTLVRSGYTFDGWNTLGDGLGTNYATGAEYTTNTAVELFAKWSANLVENGDFSSGNTGFTSSYIYTPDAQAGGPVLDAGQYMITTNANLAHGAWTSTLDKTNDAVRLYFVANGGDNVNDIVWQTATPISVTEANTVYRFEAYLASVYPESPPSLKFEIGDGTTWVELGNTVNIPVNPAGVWYLSYADGKFTHSGSYHIRLRNLVTAPAGNDFGIDDIYFGFRSNAASRVAQPGIADGDVANFNTDDLKSVPTVTTQTVTNINAATATGNGDITDLGNPNPTQHGHVWSTSPNPTIGDSKTELGASSATGVFTSSLTGLTAGANYYVRAYATNTEGTSYGGQESFTTLNIYAVTYNTNDATGGTIPDAQTKIEGADLTLAMNSGNLVRFGYTFTNWNTQANGQGTNYAMGTEYTEDGDMELFAKWSTNTYDILFNGNEATDGSMTNQTITFDQSASLTTNAFTRTGYSFNNWNTKEDGSGISYSDKALFTMNVLGNTLYARWNLIPVKTVVAATQIINNLSLGVLVNGTPSPFARVAAIQNISNLSLKVLVNGIPLPFARVTLYSEPMETNTNSEGFAYFYNVDPGDHMVEIVYKSKTYSKPITVTNITAELEIDVEFVIEEENQVKVEMTKEVSNIKNEPCFDNRFTTVLRYVLVIISALGLIFATKKKIKLGSLAIGVATLLILRGCNIDILAITLLTVSTLVATVRVYLDRHDTKSRTI